MKDKYLDQFVKKLLVIKTPREMKGFLQAVLTPEEFRAIPLRLEIVNLLKKGVAQREIVKRLGVGIATVTRGSKELQLNHFKNV